jgi:hypothetical protein
MMNTFSALELMEENLRQLIPPVELAAIHRNNYSSTCSGRFDVKGHYDYIIGQSLTGRRPHCDG